MKINPEKLTVNNIEIIVDLCEKLRAYYDEQSHLLERYSFKKYHEGQANAYASVLDMFEARGIIEEDSVDENE